MKKTKIETKFNNHNNIIDHNINVKFFDEESKLILEIDQLPNGEENWRKVFEYSTNQETEKLIINENTEQVNLIIKKESGEKVKEVTTNYLNHVIYSWILDESNQLITEKQFDINGELIVETKKYLNKEGEIIKEIEESNYQTNYEYLNGNISKVQVIDNGKLVLNEQYFYDDKGNEVRSLGYDLDVGEDVEVKKMYNSNNKIIREEQFINGEYTYIKLFEYDSNQELSKLEFRSLINDEIEITEIITKIENGI